MPAGLNYNPTAWEGNDNFIQKDPSKMKGLITKMKN
jgi:hypothetical protein